MSIEEAVKLETIAETVKKKKKKKTLILRRSCKNMNSTNAKTEHTTAKVSLAVPDYKTRCQNCGHTPTVLLIDPDTKEEQHHTFLCGVCCWGESECLDPDNW